MSTWVNIKRILRTGFFSFSRNAFVSLSSIVVMVITLSTIGSLIFLSAILNNTLTEVRGKVDINVYFITAAPEDDILAVQKRLETLPEVASATYTSREQALQEFRERHENDQVTLQALEELGDNPLDASLNIKAKSPSQYEGIAAFLQESPLLSRDGVSIVDKVDYFQNKEAIERLTRIIDSAERLGSMITVVLVAVSVLITFNTIRLAIFISREEIAVMRLVGASSSYVRGPFVVVGLLYGAVAGILAILLFYPVTYWLGGVTENFFVGMNVFDYYTKNFGQIFAILIGSGAAIGALSSWLAVRKYLKI
ncbi:ABC transporter permease [Patescibacteria group bacterium]|nr:MAG: ABC transporter permease [Patescibacteria group bacterium]